MNSNDNEPKMPQNPSERPSPFDVLQIHMVYKGNGKYCQIKSDLDCQYCDYRDNCYHWRSEIKLKDNQVKKK